MMPLTVDSMLSATGTSLRGQTGPTDLHPILIAAILACTSAAALGRFLEGAGRPVAERTLVEWLKSTRAWLGLPPINRGRAGEDYRHALDAWHRENGYPTAQEIQDGWMPVHRRHATFSQQTTSTAFSAPASAIRLPDLVRESPPATASAGGTETKGSLADPVRKPDEPEAAADVQHPDLLQFPVAVVPDGAASTTEERFREALTPAFLERNEQMQQMRSYYQSLSAYQRNKLADAAFAKLDARDEAAFISHYADIYVITRDANATLTTWTQGIFRGIRALKEAKLALSQS